MKTSFLLLSDLDLLLYLDPPPWPTDKVPLSLPLCAGGLEACQDDDGPCSSEEQGRGGQCNIQENTAQYMIYKSVIYTCLKLIKFTVRLIWLVYYKSSEIFSSPEPKAQVSFSDQNLSVVRHCRCCRCRCRKLFTFSSSSPEPLGQFQPNLAQSILGWRGFKFSENTLTNLKIFFSRTTRQFQPNLA